MTKGGAGVICERLAFPEQSFPRKRESIPQVIDNAPPTDWIPAFAGMTTVSKGSTTPNDTNPKGGSGLI